MRAHGITRRGDGSFRVRLGQHERELLRHLPGQVREIILGNDPSTYRLFPPAHLDDAAADADYRQLVGESLLDEKLAAIAVFEQTAGLDRLDEQQLYAWLGAIESLRLVLGTLLDVTEETYGREARLEPPG